MPKTIFISYRSNDSDKVDTIVANLRSLKNADGTSRYHIWFDKDSIPEGKNWWFSIVDAIIDCKVFIFMVSHEAIQSPNCIAELSYAHKINRHILPVVLGGEYEHNPSKGKKNILFWDELPRELKDDNIQFLFDTGTQAFQKLIQTLDDLLAKPKKDLHRTVERPPDPRHIDDANNNNVSIYKEARDSALRGDFSTADTLFLRLFNADDPDFGDESGAWIEAIRLYQRIIQFDDIEHRSAREKWVNYQENFPQILFKILNGIFDPKRFAEKYGNGTQNPQPVTSPQPGRQSQSIIMPIDGQKPLNQAMDLIAKGIEKQSAYLLKEAIQILQGLINDGYISDVYDLKSLLADAICSHDKIHRIPPIPDFLPQPFDWCAIPAGKVTIGYGDWKDQKYVVERTQDFNIPDFFIAKYPLTNAQYDVFVNAKDGYANTDWWAYSDDAKAWRKNNWKPRETGFKGDAHPRTNITWYESVAFTLWMSAKMKLNIHLPTEQQWQRAAIGDTGWAYPYGDEFDKNRCNFNTKSTTPVTQYPTGASLYEVMDMSGNVWEWCSTESNQGNIPLKDATNDKIYVLRGGSWLINNTALLRANVRGRDVPDDRYNVRGVRFALSQ